MCICVHERTHADQCFYYLVMSVTGRYAVICGEHPHTDSLMHRKRELNFHIFLYFEAAVIKLLALDGQQSVEEGITYLFNRILKMFLRMYVFLSLCRCISPDEKLGNW
jgi:hypothetical protein